MLQLHAILIFGLTVVFVFPTLFSIPQSSFDWTEERSGQSNMKESEEDANKLAILHHHNTTDRRIAETSHMTLPIIISSEDVYRQKNSSMAFEIFSTLNLLVSSVIVSRYLLTCYSRAHSQHPFVYKTET